MNSPKGTIIVSEEVYYPAFSPDFPSLVAGLHGKKVAVWGHLRPDGDCIGSQVALVRVLRGMGVNAYAVNAHPIPYNLGAFVGDTPFYLPESPELPEPDETITVDCSTLDRIGSSAASLRGKILLAVDHHISNPGFGLKNWIDTDSAATAEILAGIFSDCGVRMDATTAQALYVGIATDTGHFRYPATSHRVFSLCSHLLDCGARPAEAAHELFEKESIGRLRLLTLFLESLEFHHDNRVCIGFIRHSMFGETGTDRSQAEGFVDFPRSIDSVKVAVLIEEQADGSYKGSLRSKRPSVRVDQVASAFGGGGHACAAGFECRSTLQEFKAKLLSLLEKTVSA